jgi:hypothetical protein
MNSIVFTHFATPVGATLNLALDRLGAWCDAERGTLEDLLDITGHEEAIDDIEVVCALHRKAQANPKNVRHLLDAVLASLDRLLDRMCTIPLEDCVAGSVPSEFNAWVNWSLARIEDIVATLKHSLEA